MQLETQKIRDQALALALPLGKAAVVARKSALSGLDVASRSAKSGLDQAMDASQDLQRQLKRLMGRRERDSHKVMIVAGVAVALVGVGAAVLASPTVRRAVRGQVDRIRLRLRGREAMAAHKAEKDREEELLDDRLDASFPASDPVGANHVN